MTIYVYVLKAGTMRQGGQNEENIYETVDGCCMLPDNSSNNSFTAYVYK